MLQTLEGSGWTPQQTTLVHDDLGAEHILVDAARSSLTGIIDWGDMALHDPAWDFIGLVFWTGYPRARAALLRSEYPDRERVADAVWYATAGTALTCWSNELKWPHAGGPKLFTSLLGDLLAHPVG